MIRLQAQQTSSTSTRCCELGQVCQNRSKPGRSTGPWVEGRREWPKTEKGSDELLQVQRFF